MLDVHDRLHARARAARAGSTARSRRCPTPRRSPSAARPGSASRSPSWRCCSPTPRSRSTTALLDSDLPEDPDARRTSSSATSRRRCPSASPTQMRAPPRCGARSSPRASTNEHGRPRGHDVRLPPARGHRRAAGATSRARTPSRARCSSMRALWARDRGARRRRRAPTSRSTMLLDGAAAGRARRRAGCCAHGRRPLDIAAEVERYARRRARRSPSALPGVLVERRAEALARAGRARWPRRASRRRWPRRVAGLGALFSALRHRRGRRRDRAPGRARSRALHFLLGGRLHLHWLRDRSPRCRATTAGRRWRAPRCATTCSRCTRELTADVLRRAGRRRRVGALEAWLDANRAAVERCAGDPRRHPARRAPSTSRRCRSRCARCARSSQPLTVLCRRRMPAIQRS